MQRNDMFEAFAEALVERGLAASADLASARRARRDHGGSELVHLLSRGAIDSDAASEFLAEYLDLPLADDAYLDALDPSAFDAVPFELVYDLGLLPIRRTDDGRLEVAVVDPLATEGLEEAAYHADAPFDLCVVSVRRFAAVFERISGQAWRVPSSELGQLRPQTGNVVSAAGGAPPRPTSPVASPSSRPSTPIAPHEVAAVRAVAPAHGAPGLRESGTLGPLSSVVAGMGEPSAATEAAFRLLERSLTLADGREAVGRQIVETLGLVYPTVVLLSLRLPRVTVWDAQLGSGAPAPVGVGFDAPEGGLWHEVAVSGVAFVGEIPAGDPVRRGLPRVFGKASLAVPLRLGDRRIGVLVLDSGYNGDLAAPGRQIERLAGWVEQSLKRVIIRRKARSPAP